jgi:hypothetical protein
MNSFDELEADDQVRAVVLTGAGHQAFSAGADIAALARSIAGGTGQALRDFVRRGPNLSIDEALDIKASLFAFAATSGHVPACLDRFLTRREVLNHGHQLGTEHDR